MTSVSIVAECPDGGVAEHVRQLALGLPAFGYEPLVVVPSAFAHLEELRSVCDVVTVPFRRDYAHPHDELRVFLSLIPMLRKSALVHAHASKAGVLARLAARVVGRPSVYSPHGFGFVGEISTARRHFSVTVERALAPTTAALICVCGVERDIANHQRLRPQYAEVIHNGSPSCAAEDSVQTPSGLVVGTVCILRREKALDCLLDAMVLVKAAVPEANLVIAGAGPYEKEVHVYADLVGVDVTWLPYTRPAGRQLHGFDVYVLSSACESFPISVLEAQACGVPQVVTDVGGTSEAVVPETGIVVPPRDSGALAGAIIDLLRDPERRAAMSEASRKRHAERFTVDRMVAATASVYDRVLSGT
jgi:glycosyltransferase involved in cell wall biosynthesis